MVPCTAAVVTHGASHGVGNTFCAHHLLQLEKGLPLQLGGLFHGSIDLGDVGLVVLRVVHLPGGERKLSATCET